MKAAAFWIGREAVGNRFYSSIEVSSSSSIYTYIILHAYSAHNMLASQCTRYTAAHCAYIIHPLPPTFYVRPRRLRAVLRSAAAAPPAAAAAAAADGDATPSAPRPRNDQKTLVLAFGISARGNRVRPRAPTRRCEWLALTASWVRRLRRARKQNENKEKIKKKFYIMLYETTMINIIILYRADTSKIIAAPETSNGALQTLSGERRWGAYNDRGKGSRCLKTVRCRLYIYRIMYYVYVVGGCV